MVRMMMMKRIRGLVLRCEATGFSCYIGIWRAGLDIIQSVLDRV